MPFDPRLGSFIDLSNRTKLRLTGADRIRFVNGQITNDLRKVTASSAVAACILNTKGKLNALVVVSVTNDCILIDGDAALRGALSDRLERYIIADDVQVEDVSGQFSIFHVLGQQPARELGRVVSINRFALPGFDLWVARSDHKRVSDALAATYRFCDGECAEVFRIEQGIPVWGRELTEEIIPVEANLEGSCVDYEKGCYIGQEIISRMKMSGQRNKSLCGLVSDDETVLSLSQKLFSSEPGGKEIGWITSATWSDRLGKSVALGYVKRPLNHAGAEVLLQTGDNQSRRVRVSNLPFEPSMLLDK